MNRAISATLIFILSTLLFVPAMSAPTTGKLAACCLRTGSHKCEMQGSGSDAGLHLTAKCPYQSRGVLSMQSSAGLPALRAALTARLQLPPGTSAQVEVGYRISPDSSQLKRGPPNSFAFSA